MFAASFLEWLSVTHFVRGTAELTYFVDALGGSLLIAAFSWVLYVALEPYVRRRWPQSLISWTRLLGGNLRDPLVAGHVLIGLAQGVALSLALVSLQLFGPPSLLVDQAGVNILSGAGGAAAYALLTIQASVIFTLGSLFLFFLLRLLVRRNLPAALLFAALLAAQNLASPQAALFVPVNFAVDLVVVWLLIRFGVLPLLAAQVPSAVTSYPITSDFSAWHGGIALFALGTVVVVALWSFRVALGGRALFKDEFLDR